MVLNNLLAIRERRKFNNYLKSLRKGKTCYGSTYGKGLNVNVKSFGIFLDMIIPMTFGLITLGLRRWWGIDLVTIRWGK